MQKTVPAEPSFATTNIKIFFWNVHPNHENARHSSQLLLCFLSKYTEEGTNQTKQQQQGNAGDRLPVFLFHKKEQSYCDCQRNHLGKNAVQNTLQGKELAVF